ncbi:hypothetical protein CCUS01_08537 [Colletotrichum cuscutae]|uniref:Uncharacterized protein n=1 Tax=Colletotrichum cuscutae TaxID=1209917 RepID=A0AAI9UTR9_9PEZI|nr:hypothetical protein CCUS01_08537 [Colletotrichum cuscutae]
MDGSWIGRATASQSLVPGLSPSQSLLKKPNITRPLHGKPANSLGFISISSWGDADIQRLKATSHTHWDENIPLLRVKEKRAGQAHPHVRFLAAQLSSSAWAWNLDLDLEPEHEILDLCHHPPTLHDGTLQRSISYDGKIDAARPQFCLAYLQCFVVRWTGFRSLERYQLQIFVSCFSQFLSMTPTKAETFPGGDPVEASERVDAPELQRQSPIVAIPLHRRPILRHPKTPQLVDDSISGSIEMQHRRIQSICEVRDWRLPKSKVRITGKVTEAPGWVLLCIFFPFTSLRLPYCSSNIRRILRTHGVPSFFSHVPIPVPLPHNGPYAAGVVESGTKPSGSPFKPLSVTDTATRPTRWEHNHDSTWSLAFSVQCESAIPSQRPASSGLRADGATAGPAMACRLAASATAGPASVGIDMCGREPVKTLFLGWPWGFGAYRRLPRKTTSSDESIFLLGAWLAAKGEPHPDQMRAHGGRFFTLWDNFGHAINKTAFTIVAPNALDVHTNLMANWHNEALLSREQPSILTRERVIHHRHSTTLASPIFPPEEPLASIGLQ